MIYYYTLITSLPRLGKQFKITETPISRIQLEKRLTLLNKNEQALLYELEFILWQSWFSLNLPLPQLILRTKKMMLINNSFINALIEWNFNLRSVITAYRLRELQKTPPTMPNDYWYCSITTRIMNHWNEPDFGLMHTHPWLIHFNKHLSTHDIAYIEEVISQQFWQHLAVIEFTHYFDFEALIIYVLRWNIVNYWSELNAITSLDRIKELIDHVLKSPINKDAIQ